MAVDRPTLLSSCAAATTAREASFRIDAARGAPRATRVVALDPAAESMMVPFLAEQWEGTQFFSCAAGGAGDDFDDLPLTATSGDVRRLGEVLAEADFMLMVATAGNGAVAASVIGMACTLRGIMTAGVILGSDETAQAAVRALRPHARVLLVSRDPADVAGVLSAVGV